MRQTTVAVMGVLLCGGMLAVVLRGTRPELAVGLSLATGALAVILLLRHVTPVLTAIDGMVQASAIPSEYIKIVLKASGVCLLTRLTADTCRDAGETALAAKAELAGRMALLLISLPLFEDMLRLVTALAQGQVVSG